MRRFVPKFHCVAVGVLVMCLSTTLFAQSAGKHREVLSRNAEEFGFSPSAKAVLGQGVSDPDERDPNTAAAHGQTACDNDARPLQKPGQSLRNFSSYLRGKGGQIRHALAGGNTAQALYLLGYSTHAIQDFAFYQGMTRAESEFLSQKGTDPSIDPDNLERAEKYTRELIQAAHTALGKEIWEHLLSFSGNLPSERELTLLVGLKSGRTHQDEKKLLSTKFEMLATDTRSVRWEGLDEQARAAIASFVEDLNEAVVLNIAESNKRKGLKIDNKHSQSPAPFPSQKGTLKIGLFAIRQTTQNSEETAGIRFDEGLTKFVAEQLHNQTNVEVIILDWPANQGFGGAVAQPINYTQMLGKGRQAKVDAVIVASITQFDLRSKGIKIPGVASITDTSAHSKIEGALIDVFHGQVLGELLGDGRETKRGYDGPGLGQLADLNLNGNDFINSLPGKAMQKAVNLFVKQVHTLSPKISREAETLPRDNPPAGLSFVQSHYQFDIERGFDQWAEVEVVNRDGHPHRFVLVPGGISQDIVTGFIGKGSVDEVYELAPGETKIVRFVATTPHAKESSYKLPINLYDMDNIPAGKELPKQAHDTSEVLLNVRAAQFRIKVQQVAENPGSMAKSFDIKNDGPEITDLSVRLNSTLAPRAVLRPAVEGYHLSTGESVVVTVEPLLSDNFQPCEGDIEFSGAGQTIKSTVRFALPNGKKVFTVKVGSSETNASATHYCTNQGGGSSPTNASEKPEGDLWADWRHLIDFKVPQLVEDSLKRVKGFVLRLDKGHGDISLDYYGIKITKLPPGMSAEGLFARFRLNINNFINPHFGKFTPYDEDEALKLTAKNPISTIFHIALPGLAEEMGMNLPRDNGSVIVSDYDLHHFTLTTVNTEKDGDHPVSGNREFGIKQDADGMTIMYTRGADRVTMNPPIFQYLDFFGARLIWQSFQNDVKKYVEDNGGTAVILAPIRGKNDWRQVQKSGTSNHSSLIVPDANKGLRLVSFAHGGRAYYNEYAYAKIEHIVERIEDTDKQEKPLPSAYLTARFSTAYSYSVNTPHDTYLFVNGNEVGKILNSIPEGTYTFPVSPMILNYREGIDPGQPNIITTKVVGMNPGHRIIANEFKIIAPLSNSPKVVVASSQQEAEKIVRSLPNINHDIPDVGIFANNMGQLPTDLTPGQKFTVKLLLKNLGEKTSEPITVSVYNHNPSVKNKQKSKIPDGIPQALAMLANRKSASLSPIMQDLSIAALRPGEETEVPVEITFTPQTTRLYFVAKTKTPDFDPSNNVLTLTIISPDMKSPLMGTDYPDVSVAPILGRLINLPQITEIKSMLFNKLESQLDRVPYLKDVLSNFIKL